ncbi:MAG TPA: DedA family protein/thiosulfate sulfurtransferase GlpE [Candidatus Acidoferrum sp.]|nr:DedA family protein/thiosulfate sulfurtransferase GlpE [Candidatus Acidoferrum sp.]
MNQTTQFLITNGLPIIFGAVFIDQIGVPIPAAPWLLAAGALAASGKFPWLAGLGLSMLACLIADFIWFYLGRLRGTQVLGFLCRISLEPDSCVRRTVNVFTRYGWRGIIIAKFIPGMSTVTPPLAGMSKLSAGQFLFFDTISSLLYSGGFILIGFIFSNQIAQIAETMENIGGDALILIVAFLLAYIAYKYWQRQSLLRELRMAKISVDELGKMLGSGENPLILDVRSSLELEQDPAIIRGAVHLALDDLQKGHGEFPHDREIIVYCDCPNEESSAKTALLLRRRGFKRVRPLLGGIEAWRKGKNPMGVWTRTTTSTRTTILVGQEKNTNGKTPATESHSAKAEKGEEKQAT